MKHAMMDRFMYYPTNDLTQWYRDMLKALYMFGLHSGDIGLRFDVKEVWETQSHLYEGTPLNKNTEQIYEELCTIEKARLSREAY